MFTDTEVGMAMAHQRRMRTFSKDVQGLIDEMDDDIVKLRKQVAGLQHALGVEQAHAAGLKTVVDAFKASSAQNPLMAPTGRKFEDGNPEFRLHALYAQAFDAVITKFKIVGDRLRLQAK